jgi:hypothetical protein
VRGVWRWLAARQHRPMLGLWLQTYAQSLVEPKGPCADFARKTVEDWLQLLAARQPERSEGNPEKRQRRDAGQPERSEGNPEKRQRRDAGQPESLQRSRSASAEPALALAVLRGALLDLLATGDEERTAAVVEAYLNRIPSR